MYYYEKANFNRYKTFWAENLYNHIVAIDPSPDKRYEAWILDILRKQSVSDVRHWFKLHLNNLPKEYLQFLLQNMLLRPEFYNPTRYSSLANRNWKQFFIDKFGLDKLNLPENVKNFLRYTHPYPPGTTFEKYIMTDEDIPALQDALKVHYWLSESNQIPAQQKNIYNFKTIQELYRLTTPHLENFQDTFQRSQVKEGQDYKILFEDQIDLFTKVQCIQILSHTGAQYWGRGTTWCIAAESGERYCRTYTSNFQAPMIFYITINESKKDKWAFVEGDDAQYRSKENNELSIEDLEEIPENHKNILAKYLHIFNFLISKEDATVDFESYFEEFTDETPPEHVGEVFDYTKPWNEKTEAEQELTLAWGEIIDEWLIGDIQYDELSDDNVGDYIDEEPAGQDEEGNPLWSDEQREDAEMNYQAEIKDNYTKEIWREFSNKRIDDLWGAYKEAFTEYLGSLEYMITKDNVQKNISAEAVGIALVQEHGYRKYLEKKKQKKDLIENLLKRFKF